MTAPEKHGIRLGWSARASVCAAAACSGVLTILAFPPVGWWVLAFAVPLPLVWAAGRPGVGRWSAAIAALAGIAPMWAWEQQWIFGVSWLGAPILVVVLSAYAGAFVWICRWARDRLGSPAWLVGPVVWAGLEMLRGEVIGYGYPWLLAGHPLIESQALSRAGTAVGAVGVSFLMVWVAMAGYGVVAARGRRRTVAAGLLTLGAAAWISLSLAPHVPTRGTLRVAAVQTNVPQSVRAGWPPADRMRDFDRMLELSRDAAEAEPRPDLIVWPETMFPGASLDANALNEGRAAGLSWVTDIDVEWPPLRFVVTNGLDGFEPTAPVTGPFEQGGQLMMPTSVASDSLFAWQGRLGVPFLVGASGLEGRRVEVDPATNAITDQYDARYNSSYLVEGGRVVGDRYDKMHLTPFGEVMPYISAWPWLERTLLSIGVGAEGMAFDLESGDRPVWHEVQSPAGLVRVATPICFEGIMPGVCRRLAYVSGDRHADLLVQITNEGWFGDFDAGREQHLQIVRWRALELGTSVVRAANTGVSAVIGPDGRVLARGVGAGDSRVDGVLAADVPLAEGATVYAKAGDAVGWANLAALGGVLVACVAAGRRGSAGAGPWPGRQSPGGSVADEEGTQRPARRRKDDDS